MLFKLGCIDRWEYGFYHYRVCVLWVGIIKCSNICGTVQTIKFTSVNGITLYQDKVSYYCIWFNRFVVMKGNLSQLEGFFILLCEVNVLCMFSWHVSASWCCVLSAVVSWFDIFFQTEGLKFGGIEIDKILLFKSMIPSCKHISRNWIKF